MGKRVEKCSQKDDRGQFHRSVASITGRGPRGLCLDLAPKPRYQTVSPLLLHLKSGRRSVLCWAHRSLGRTGEVKGHGVGSGCGLCRHL